MPIKITKKHILWLVGAICSLAILSYILFPFLLGGTSLKASTRVVDMDGNTLYTIHNGGPEFLLTEQDIQEAREERPNAKVPNFFLHALTSSEDQHFFDHVGIDFGALVSGGLQGRGASTLTTQTIKLRFFSDSARTLPQKGREFLLALLFDSYTSKEAILADYLNRASFGRNYIGIYSASLGYFGKVPSELSLGESAMLVGLLPAPESYSPVKSMSAAKERQALVLQRMVDEGFLSEDEALRVREVPLTITSQQREILAPHATQEALQRAKEIFPDIELGGYTIHTTIHLGWHQEITTIIQKDLMELADKKVSNAAAVVIEPDSGAIRAMIGSKDYFATDIDGAFNVALAKRQPGSSLKPFTYLAAFLQGDGPGTLVYDIESSFPTANGSPYIPRNYDLKFHGPVSMRNALGSSLNIPAVKTLEKVGLAAWHTLLRDFGISFEKDPEFYGLGITLGGGEVTLTELTHAYSLLANNGMQSNSYLISSIEDDQGTQVYRHRPSASGSRMTSAPDAFQAAIVMVNDILRDNSAREISFGLTSRLRITDSVAVKTGTTKDYRDNWAFGYTPKIAMGVWVGNNDNTPMEGVTGITGAIPILHDFLRIRTEETNNDMVQWPSSPLLKKISICSFSNMLATSLCPYTREELYMEGNEPREGDTWFVAKDIDTESGLLADDTCRGSIESKVFVSVPLPLKRWAKSVLLEEAPTRTCSGKVVQVATTFTVSHPKNGDIFTLRSSLPNEAQRIPLHIDGTGFLQTTLFLDGTPIEIEGDLPITTFIDANSGEHTLISSDSSVSSVKFAVKPE